LWRVAVEEHVSPAARERVVQDHVQPHPAGKHGDEEAEHGDNGEREPDRRSRARPPDDPEQAARGDEPETDRVLMADRQ
jgi:hypothetical protein